MVGWVSLKSKQWWMTYSNVYVDKKSINTPDMDNFGLPDAIKNAKCLEIGNKRLQWKISHGLSKYHSLSFGKFHQKPDCVRSQVRVKSCHLQPSKYTAQLTFP